jgi:hypothetical protein
MDLRKHLTGRNLKWNWEAICAYLIEHPSKIPDLIGYCLDEETIVQQNAGAVLGKIIDHDKKVLVPFQMELTEMLNKELHDAVHRAIMRIFQLIEISEEVEGYLYDAVIRFLNKADAPIAVKAFGMTAGRRICEKYPELAQELYPIVETLVEQKLSTGIVARGKSELKLLSALMA